MKRLEDKTALVTGGGRGIGLSLVRQLATEGARVVVNDLDAAEAQAAAAAIRDAGGQALAFPGNVASDDFAKRFVEAALSAFGDIHIVVNNAGYVWNSPLHKITDEQWDAIHDVHLKAPFRILRQFRLFLEERIARERAVGAVARRKVVNVSSVSAIGGAAGQANYAAAKAGVHGLTRALAREWGPLGVNVNCVAFGYIETRLTQEIVGETTIEIEGAARRVGLPRSMIEAARAQIPLGRAGTPAEAAGAILLLCFPEADYVTGQVLEVSGGMSR